MALYKNEVTCVSICSEINEYIEESLVGQVCG